MWQKKNVKVCLMNPIYNFWYICIFLTFWKASNKNILISNIKYRFCYIILSIRIVFPFWKSLIMQHFDLHDWLLSDSTSCCCHQMLLFTFQLHKFCDIFIFCVSLTLNFTVILICKCHTLQICSLFWILFHFNFAKDTSEKMYNLLVCLTKFPYLIKLQYKSQ